jgi:N,N'-diacetyllegionaminate synthase
MSSAPDSLLIIAEAAQGYEGDRGVARALVRAAASAGADALKLQLVYADELCTPDYKHHALFRSLEMADEVWHGLARDARENRIGLMLDIFGSRSLALAAAVGAAGIKIHSTDMSNIGLLREVAGCPVPLVLLSTGGCTRDEIGEALIILAQKSVVLLHGFQGYPTPLASNQIPRLAALQELAARSRRARPAQLGFADHVPSDDPLRFTLAATALGLGARVIEKHITLANVMKMEDHESALNPDELAHFVATMRGCMQALAPVLTVTADDFGMHESELAYRANTRKHVVALRPLAAGSTLAPDMVGLKRTSAERFICDPRQVYGRRLVRDVPASTAIAPEMLEGIRQ